MAERRQIPDRRKLLYRLGGRRATDPKPDHRPVPLDPSPTELELPAWLSVSAYARTYGLTRNTVYKLLDHDLLQTYRVGRLVRILNMRPDLHRPTEVLAPLPDRPHQVYFVQCEGLVKIGHTNDMTRRLKNAATFCPYDFQVIHTEQFTSEGEALAQERVYHERFRGTRVKGEWFQPTKALAVFLDAKQVRPPNSS